MELEVLWEVCLGAEVSGLLVSSEAYFEEVVSEALASRKVQSSEPVHKYIVDLLMRYMDIRKLYDLEDEKGRLKRETLAEMMLKASQLERSAKVEILRKLGDSSLYITGFFSESLQHKIVDVDYYVDMGGIAYSYLAQCIRDEQYRQVYEEFAEKFQTYVDVLNLISEKSFVQADVNLLRLYDKYVKTGSSLVKERLVQLGIDVTEVQSQKFKLIKQ